MTDDLDAVYRDRFPPATRARREAMWVEIARHLQRHVVPGSVLDIGCGEGSFIRNIVAQERWATDVRDMSGALPPDVRFVQADGLALREFLPAASFDTVFMSNYLEHLPSRAAVVEQLAVAHDLLTPSGRLIVLQPNIRLVGGAYWGPLDHHVALTEWTLREASAVAGLREVKTIVRFLPYTTKSRLPQHPALVRAYLAFPPAWWLMGKQTLFVAERAPVTADDIELTVVVPVYQEGEAVAPVLVALDEAIRARHQILVVYDFDADPTVPVIARVAADRPAIVGLRNDLGRGVLNAMRAGIGAADGRYIVISMADGSDEPHVIDSMVELARGGAQVVAASRYMAGGRQIGGPFLKRTLSRLAGVSLHVVARMPIHDPTNNFKLYARAFLDDVTIESRAGFELALELSVKAMLMGRPMAEVPTTWRDRSAGESHFRLRAWLPHYLRWYVVAFSGRFTRAGRHRLAP